MKKMFTIKKPFLQGKGVLRCISYILFRLSFQAQFSWLYWRAWMARVSKNFCPSVQDKAVLLRLHKKCAPTQLSTWKLAPFRDGQDKPLDQSWKKQHHLHPDVRMCRNSCFNSMKSFTWLVVDPHTFSYQSQKWEQQVQDHLIWQIVDQWYLLYGYPCLNVPGCTWLCLALQIRSISPEGVWTLKPYSRLRWMDGIGWTSLNACLLRAPLCGDNNHIPVTTTSSENYIQWWF